jgi:hypothetical protein
MDKVPSTSASPPVLAKGLTSEAIMASFMSGASRAVKQPHRRGRVTRVGVMELGSMGAMRR